LNEFLKNSLKQLRTSPERLRAFISAYVCDLSQFFTALRKLTESTRDVEALFQLFVVLDLSAFLYPLMIRLQARDMLTNTVPGPSNTSLLSLIVSRALGSSPLVDLPRGRNLI